jgi:predicted RNA binding protein YcfA (HicA-like mRNA interferase family)
VVAKLLDQRGAIKLMRQDGWRVTRGGKHVVKMIKPGRRPVTLPRNHGEPYSRGLSHDIIKQAGLNSTEATTWSSRSKYAKRGRTTGHGSGSSRDASRQVER